MVRQDNRYAGVSNKLSRFGVCFCISFKKVFEDDDQNPYECVRSINFISLYIGLGMLLFVFEI